jgi:hypothetical protein
MDEPIPVGEVICPEYQIEFNWLEDDCAKRIPVAQPNAYTVVWGFPFAAEAPIKTGKPPPTGILTVHEGRVGGIPMCVE